MKTTEVSLMEAMPSMPVVHRSPRSKQLAAKENKKKPQPIPVRQSPRKNLAGVLKKGRKDKEK